MFKKFIYNFKRDLVMLRQILSQHILPSSPIEIFLCVDCSAKLLDLCLYLDLSLSYSSYPVLLILPCPTRPTLSYSSYPVLFILPCPFILPFPTRPTLFYSPFPVLLILPCPTRPKLSNSLFHVLLVLPCPTRPTLSYSS